MTEVPNPAELAPRHMVRLGHSRVAPVPARARRIQPRWVGDMDGLLARLAAAGALAKPDGLPPGFRRAYVHDPFGNRLELLPPAG